MTGQIRFPCVRYVPGLLLLLGLAIASANADPPLIDKLHGVNCPDVHVQPFGSFVRKFQAIQADKAQASNFVVFLDEWYEGGVQLGPYGLYHLNQMAHRLPNVPFRVQVQPQADPAINEARKQVVIQGLVALGITEAPDRVDIAYPQAEGLRYEDIWHVWVHSQLYPQTINPYSGNGYFGYGGGYMGGYGAFGYGSMPYGGFGYGARPLIYGY